MSQVKTNTKVPKTPKVSKSPTIPKILKVPKIPTEFEIKQNIDKWTEYAETILKIIDRIKCEEKEDEFDKECELYKNETSDERYERSLKDDEWIYETTSCEFIRDSSCAMRQRGECYYSNYSDVRYMKGYYRLKGTDIRVCNVCDSDESRDRAMEYTDNL
jgi:hypothetical protein